MGSDWPLVLLGNHVDACLGKMLDAKKNKGILQPYLGNSNVRWGCFDLADLAEMKFEPHEEVRYGLMPGDLIVCEGGEPGRCAIWTAPVTGMKIQKALHRIRPKATLNNFYLYYWFCQSARAGLLEPYFTGTTIKHLTGKAIAALEIPLPPVQMQAAMVDVLKSLDDRITLLRETNATLEAIAQALFKSWFVNFDPVHAKQQGCAPEGMDEATAGLFPDSFEESELGVVPKGWKAFRLADVVERITKGTTPTTLKRPFVATGINFVKAESMTDDGQFIPEKFAFIDDETHVLLKRSQLKAGDVLISIAGTIGRTAVITQDFLPANTNQAVALIRPLPDRFPSGLISRFLKRSETQQLLGERVVQAVQANLSLGTLSEMRVVVPPVETTAKLYDSGLAQIDASKVINAAKIRTLATLRDTLLPRLISGQLRLPESEAMVEAVL